MVPLDRFRQVIHKFHMETADAAKARSRETGKTIDECIDEVITQTAAQAQAELEILQFIQDAGSSKY